MYTKVRSCLHASVHAHMHARIYTHAWFSLRTPQVRGVPDNLGHCKAPCGIMPGSLHECGRSRKRRVDGSTPQTWRYYIYMCTYMMGAIYSVTRCSFGLLAASLAGTLRDPCGARAKHRDERKRNIQYKGLLTPVIWTFYYLGNLLSWQMRAG